MVYCNMNILQKLLQCHAIYECIDGSDCNEPYDPLSELFSASTSHRDNSEEVDVYTTTR